MIGKALKLVWSVIRDYLFCWDALLSIASIAAMHFVLPEAIPALLVKDFASIGISVAAIVFSICLAALAITVSGADDAFVVFLEVDRVFTGMLGRFRFALVLTLVNLVLTIGVFGVSALAASKCAEAVLSRSQIAIYVGFFLYSLFVVMNCTLEMFHYARRRADFLRLTFGDTGDGQHDGTEGRSED